jgi:hypothetical protein
MSSGLMEPLNPTTYHLPRIVENPIHDVENQVILEKPILRRSVAMDYEYQLFKEELTRSFGHGGWGKPREEGFWDRVWVYFTQLWERIVDN